MATFKAVIFTGGKHLKQDGTTNIKIRVYHNGSSQYLPTAYYTRPEWVNNDGTISSLCPDYELLNYDLGELMQQFRKICLKLGSERLNRMRCAELKKEFEKNINMDSEFIDIVAFTRDIVAKTVKRKTAEWYDCSMKSFKSFYGSDKIDVREINVTNLNEYKSRLMNMVEPGTVNNYLRGIRAIFNKAKQYYNNEDLDIIRIPNDPFKKVTIPMYRRKRKNLSPAIIMQIRDTEFSTERANMARDVFMMQFYLMGINIGDLYRLKGSPYGRVNYERSKVTTHDDNRERIMLSIKIEPELDALIRKYSGDDFLSYIKVKYSNFNTFLRAVNIGLKQISDELSLGLDISSNWSRHSWASIARNRANISKADIDFCLGHVNNDYKMADIYIDIDYSICDRANRAVLDLLQRK